MGHVIRGRDIRFARTVAGISQADLANALGLVNRSALVDIELERIDITQEYANIVVGIVKDMKTKQVGDND